jgi:hypothetical protein
MADSWWVKRSREDLQRGAEQLAKQQVPATARAQSKSAARKTVSAQRFEQRVEREVREAKGTAAARELNERLKPTAGAFSSIPKAE